MFFIIHGVIEVFMLLIQYIAAAVCSPESHPIFNVRLDSPFRNMREIANILSF